MKRLLILLALIPVTGFAEIDFGKKGEGIKLPFGVNPTGALADGSTVGFRLNDTGSIVETGVNYTVSGGSSTTELTNLGQTGLDVGATYFFQLSWNANIASGSQCWLVAVAGDGSPTIDEQWKAQISVHVETTSNKHLLGSLSGHFVADATASLKFYAVNSLGSASCQFSGSRSPPAFGPLPSGNYPAMRLSIWKVKNP